jgi:DNA polymerase III alpha subunit
MKKVKKRRQQLQQRTVNNALMFNTMFGARQKFGEVPADVEQRIAEEVLVFQNLGVAEQLLTLKDIIDHIKLDLGFQAEPTKGILAASYAAYCLGLEPSNPMDTSNELNPLDFTLPFNLTISYDNEIRNQAVDWMKSHGYEVTTYLGQPLLKLNQVRVLIRRVVKG